MKKYIYVYIFIISSIVCACQGFLKVDPPRDQLINKTIFNDKDGAISAVSGLYIMMMEQMGIASGSLSLYMGLAADELKIGGINELRNQFFSNQILVDNSANYSSLWSSAYKVIYATNACIEGIETNINISELDKSMLLAELKCIRSLLYFNLINLYGDVPLIISSDYKINRSRERTNYNLVYDFIEEDLRQAKNVFDNATPQNYRISKYVPSALLAKILFFRENYEEAELISSELINSSSHVLENNIDNTFIKDSKEIIWGFLPVSMYADTWDGYYFNPSNSQVQPQLFLYDEFYEIFSNSDLRKIHWIGENIFSNKSFYFPKKYKDRSKVGRERYSIIRLAEIILINSESNYELGRIDKSIERLNLIRRRANLDDYVKDGKTNDELINHIMVERKRELFCEGGIRWFDLKRTNKLTSTLSSIKQFWKDSSVLLPIPQQEINFNNKLKQNDGY